MKDYYNILGVPRTATNVQIKKAFHNLAKIYHPDLNPGNAFAESKFKEINEAYAVLSDFKKKWTYDLELNQPQVISTQTTSTNEPRKTYYPKGYSKEKNDEIESKVTRLTFKYIALILFVAVSLGVYMFKLNGADKTYPYYDSVTENNSEVNSPKVEDTNHLTDEEFYRLLSVEFEDSQDSTLWKANEDSLYHVIDSLVQLNK